MLMRGEIDERTTIMMKTHNKGQTNNLRLIEGIKTMNHPCMESSTSGFCWQKGFGLAKKIHLQVVQSINTTTSTIKRRIPPITFIHLY